MPDQTAPLERRARASWAIAAGVAGLIALHLALAALGTWNKSATFDETAYIGNGYSFWANRDYRLSPDAVLVEYWLTLPLYLSDITAPPTDSPAWRMGDVWTYGIELLFRLGNDGVGMLRTARFQTSLLSAALALITFLWARKLFGVGAAFVALTFYVLNPTVLAHGSNATSDLAASLAFTGSLWALWTVLHRLTPLTVAVSCLAVGLSFVTKLSAVLLVPIGLGMALVALVGNRPLEWRLFGKLRGVAPWWGRALMLPPLVVVHVVVAYCIIWAMFGFRYESMIDPVAGVDSMYGGNWDELLKAAREPLPGQTGERNATVIDIVQWAREHRILPEGYLHTFLGSVTSTAIRSAFLNGRYGIYGFASFFPLCFLYKMPPALFLAIALAIVTHTGRRIHQIRREGQNPWLLLWRGFYATSPLWILLVVYWTTSITRGINIGLRHILPTFPATFILAGLCGVWLTTLFRRPASAVPPRSDAPTVAPVDAIETPAEAQAATSVAATSTAAVEPAEPVAVPPAPPPAPDSFLAASAPSVRYVMTGAVALCLVWQVIDTALAGGNYLAYFNVIAGGSENGYHHLVDSSLDWGQELGNLKRWLEEHEAELPPNVYVSYFGTTPPSYYGLVEPQFLPGYLPIYDLEPDRARDRILRELSEIHDHPREFGFQEGIYCISATSLQCVYNGDFPGPWRVDHEQRFQAIYNLVKIFAQNENNPAVFVEIMRQAGVTNFDQGLKLMEQARFGRLCEYLRRREPDDSVNHAILIYHLTRQDLREAFGTAPVERYPAPTKPGQNVPF